MNAIKVKRQKLALRHRRVRSKIFGTADIPRLSVRRSLKNIFLQLIDDSCGKTLVAVDSRLLKLSLKNPFKGKTGLAYEAGMALAVRAKKKGLERVCFDRGGYAYHGRVRAAAEGARNGGLIF
ncbi:MAG: 50S ribosomal protein L18 [Candidatus Magasanikbacteria bacterium]|nr:50S ribosomal protein L18 [Candidatus Magasanikbacteria bacterium]